MIGVVAGVGPFAGLDLVHKILDETRANKDQDHLPILSWSQPGTIPDRTKYLLGETAVNPAYAILEQCHNLAKMSTTVVGIPCNTAHAPPIFDVIQAELAVSEPQLCLLNMIAEVGQFLRAVHPEIEQVGVLSTMGTAVTGVYPLNLEPLGFSVLTPPDSLQTDRIHPAIYDPEYGIKACGAATERARQDLLFGARALRDSGAQALILGCTEIPLAIQSPTLFDMVVVDPTRILARSLIRAVDPSKLKPMPINWGNK